MVRRGGLEPRAYTETAQVIDFTYYYTSEIYQITIRLADIWPMAAHCNWFVMGAAVTVGTVATTPGET